MHAHAFVCVHACVCVLLVTVALHILQLCRIVVNISIGSHE